MTISGVARFRAFVPDVAPRQRPRWRQGDNVYARSHPLHHAAANQPATAPIASQVYNVTSGKTLPQWLSENKKSSLKRNDDYLRRLELIQDFEFPAACQRLKVTPDQQFIFATGYHPPMVRTGRVGGCMGLHGSGHVGAPHRGHADAGCYAW